MITLIPHLASRRTLFPISRRCAVPCFPLTFLCLVTFPTTTARDCIGKENTLVPHSPDKSNHSVQILARSGIRKSAADFPHINGPSTASQCYTLRARYSLFPDLPELLQYQSRQSIPSLAESCSHYTRGGSYVSPSLPVPLSEETRSPGL
jgi:hypothetical protein